MMKTHEGSCKCGSTDNLWTYMDYTDYETKDYTGKYYIVCIRCIEYLCSWCAIWGIETKYDKEIQDDKIVYSCKYGHRGHEVEL